eukprot:GEZU01015566.1.p1 GENE.GEZU01015566.1~~GEZU01015566.1.p1  ORF type:complete len:337 (-),score=118.33 GEZU01015566.1:2756-3766(-)
MDGTIALDAECPMSPSMAAILFQYNMADNNNSCTFMAETSDNHGLDLAFALDASIFPDIACPALVPEMKGASTTLAASSVTPAVLPATAGQQTERNWTVVKSETSIGEADCTIVIKSRKDSETIVPDETLYNSIKYQVVHTVTAPINSPFIMVGATVVDPESDEEVLKLGKKIVSGNVDHFVLSRVADNKFEGEMRLQFTDVSYHHGNKPFALKVSYYSDAVDGGARPFLTKVSPSFMIRARRPGGADPKCKSEAQAQAPAATKVAKKRSSRSVDPDVTAAASVAVIPQQHAKVARTSFFPDAVAKITELDLAMALLTSEERAKAKQLIAAKFFSE